MELGRVWDDLEVGGFEGGGKVLCLLGQTQKLLLLRSNLLPDEGWVQRSRSGEVTPKRGR